MDDIGFCINQSLIVNVGTPEMVRLLSSRADRTGIKPGSNALAVGFCHQVARKALRFYAFEAVGGRYSANSASTPRPICGITTNRICHLRVIYPPKRRLVNTSVFKPLTAEVPPIAIFEYAEDYRRASWSPYLPFS